jgi:hypothetical protein
MEKHIYDSWGFDYKSLLNFADTLLDVPCISILTISDSWGDEIELEKIRKEEKRDLQ